MSEPTHAYIGRAKCGCIRGAVVDDPKKPSMVAKWLAGFVKSGYAIEHVSVETVAVEMKRCPHVLSQ